MSVSAPAAPQAEEVKAPWTPPWWVKAFFVWHVFCMICWSLPSPPPEGPGDGLRGAWDRFLGLNRKLKREPWSPVRPYMISTGLWQFWDMFAPNPNSLEVWLDAEVHFQDGSRQTVLYPKVSSMSHWDRFVKERHFKYVERVNPDVFAWKRPALAQWLALKAANDPKNPPVLVDLRRHFRVLRPYGQKSDPVSRTEAMGSFQVDQVKLRRAKGW